MSEPSKIDLGALATETLWLLLFLGVAMLESLLTANLQQAYEYK